MQNNQMMPVGQQAMTLPNDPSFSKPPPPPPPPQGMLKGPAPATPKKEKTWKDKRDQARKHNLAECCKICCFFVFLLIFSIAMLLEQSAMSSRFADHIRSMLDGGAFPLDKVENVMHLYPFLEQTFVPALYQNNTDTNLAIESSRYLHPIDSSNRMMGVVRIRQVRVGLSEDCQVSPMFTNYKIPCYPNYDSGTMSKDNFGPDGIFTWREDPLGNGYSGIIAQYDQHGFSQYLSTNRTAALITVDELQANGFLDIATRAVFIDFTVWNSNMGSYAIMRICFEFSPSGTAAYYVEVSILSEGMLKPGGLGTDTDWAGFVFMLIVMCFVIWYMCEEAQELYEERFEYLMDGWNVMDWVNMIILIIAFVYRCMVWSEAAKANIGRAQLANQNSFSSIRQLASKSELVRYLYAFNAVMLWAKCVKYLRHLPIVKVLIRTVWDSFKLFLPFLAMFMIAMVGFTMAYKIGFGDKIQELTSFARALIYLGRAFLRDVNLMPVYQFTPMFGALLILLFYIMLMLVGMNVLLACIADALYRSKFERKEQKTSEWMLHEDEPLEEFVREVLWHLSKAFIMMLPRKFRASWAQKVAEYDPRLVGAASNLQQGKLDAMRDNLNQEYSERVGQVEQTGNPLYMLGDFNPMLQANQMDALPPPAPALTSEMLMRAIEHMSGRVLSEVQEVGIEIRSELHDVCERVAQMQMAVQELEWRTELVRREQQEVL